MVEKDVFQLLRIVQEIRHEVLVQGFEGFVGGGEDGEGACGYVCSVRREYTGTISIYYLGDSALEQYVYIQGIIHRNNMYLLFRR